MADLFNLHDFAARAREQLPPDTLAFLEGGALDEITRRENEAAWLRRRLRPRVLRGLSDTSTETTLLGKPAATPIGVAPTALHGLFHRDGEVATARAAASSGALMVASTMSSRTLEEIASAGGRRWFQLYVQREREVTEKLVRRAEAAGYEALVVTADTPVAGLRERDLRSGAGDTLVPSYGNFGTEVADARGPTWAARLFERSLGWADIDLLRGMTALPIVLKGIMTGEDAALAVDHGAAAVWVSNHGGRQLDRVPATIDVLEEVVAAMRGRAEVYIDGGARRGIDVVIALALGARAVFFGRPILHALTVDGEAGVRAALEIVQLEFVNAMALLGVGAVGEITREHVI